MGFGAVPAFSSSENHPAALQAWGETLLLWSCKASSSRGADSPLDSAIQISWWRNVENAGLESRASNAESRRAGQCSAWQTVHIRSEWFMELFLLKASSCTLESGAARLVKIQYPDSLNWLPAAVITVAKLNSRFMQALQAATSLLLLRKRTVSKCYVVWGHFHGNVSIPWHPFLCCGVSACCHRCTFFLHLRPLGMPWYWSYGFLQWLLVVMGLRVEEMLSVGFWVS